MGQTGGEDRRLCLTHNFGRSRGPNNDGQIRSNKGHAGLNVLIDSMLGLVQPQCHVTCLFNMLQLLISKLLPIKQQQPLIIGKYNKISGGKKKKVS